MTDGPSVPLEALEALADEWGEYSKGCQCCTSHVKELRDLGEEHNE